MGIQLVVRATDPIGVEKVLGNVAEQCEVFPMRPGHFGVSIPRKVVDSIGEQVLKARLEALDHFDLWEGSWK